MKHLLFLFLTTFAIAQISVPISNGKLTTNLDANSKDILAVDQINFGAGTPAGRIHILPSGSPTTIADGIRWGGDTGIYRSASGTIAITGNLVVSGSVAASNGIVQLSSTNVFSGTNSFNGATNIGGLLTFQQAFAVSDNTVRNGIRTALALTPGTDVQAYSALLLAISNLNPADGNVIVGDGSTWVTESGATLRTSLGLGTGNNVTFTNGTLSGTLTVSTTGSSITGKLTIAGASSASNGLQLGSGGTWYGSGSGTATDEAVTINGNVLLGDANTDTVTLASGKLFMDSGGTTWLQSTGANALTITATNLTISGAVTFGSPLATTQGGLGASFGSLVADRMLYTTATGVFGNTTITSAGRAILDDASISAIRTTLELGGAALLNVGTTAGTVAAGDDSRLSDTRVPSGSAAGGSSDLEGTYPSSVTIKANAVALSTDTTGNYVMDLTAGTGVTIGGTNNVEGAQPTISIGQSVSTGATPTFSGLTVTNAIGATTLNISGTATTQNLVVNGTATFSTAPTFSSLTLEELILSNTSSAGIGKIKGFVLNATVFVDKDGAWGSDTRTGLLNTDMFRPFDTIAAATTASAAGDLIYVLPASTEYTVPADFGADNRIFYLAGANINGFTTAADKDYTITGPGKVTGNVTVSHASSVIVCDSTIEGNVTVSNGSLRVHNVTGDIAVSGGTLTVTGTITGNVVVTGGTLIARQITGNLSTTTGSSTADVVTGTVTSVSGTTIVRESCGAVTHTDGTATLNTVTGAVTAASGTLTLRGLVLGSLSVAGATVNLHNQVVRSDAGTAVAVSSGTLNAFQGAGAVASSTSEAAVAHSGGTLNAFGNLTIRGTVSGTITAAGSSVNPRSYKTVAVTGAANVTPGASTRILFTSDGASHDVTLQATGAVEGETYVLLGPDSNSVEVLDSGAGVLNGNFVMDAGDTLTLTFDGTNFRETGRSAN